MPKKAALLLFVLLLSGLPSGCAGEKPQVAVRNVAEKNILFNPKWTGIPTENVARSPWPSTDAYQPSGTETLDFREYLIDRQGLTFRNAGDYYRRFDSVRTGRRLR